MTARTLNQNYQANLDILKENIKRGMTASQAIRVIENWRTQFVSHNLYGDDEKAFINQALELVEPTTKMTIVEM